MEKIKIGILGTGAVAYRWYLKGLCNENEKYEVTVLCDINEKAVKKASDDFKVENYCTDLSDMFDYDLDLIIVLTRHKDHYENIKSIMNEGINVYSEKPFSENYDQGLELLNLSKKKNLFFGSAPQIMLSSRNKKLKDLIEKRKIGKVTYVKASCSNPGPAGRSDTNYNPEWFYNDGGSLKSLGIYTLSILIWLFGTPKKISANMGIALQEREVLYGDFKGLKFPVSSYDNVVGMFDFGNSLFAVFDGSYCVPNQSKNEFEIHGEKGSLYVSGFGGPESIVFKDLLGQEYNLGPDDDCHLRWNLSWGVEDLVDSITENKEPIVNAEFALNIIKIMDLMEKASKENKVILI